MTNKHIERCRISPVRRVGALSPPHPLACGHQRQPRATRLRSLQPPSSQPLGRSQGGPLWEPAGGSPKGEEQTRNTHANNCSLKPLPLVGYPLVTAICGDRILRRRRTATGPVQAEGCESLRCPPSTLQGKMDVVCSEHGTRISSATQSRVFTPELDASHNVMLREEKPGPTQHSVRAEKLPHDPRQRARDTGGWCRSRIRQGQSRRTVRGSPSSVLCWRPALFHAWGTFKRRTRSASPRCTPAVV